MELVVEGVELMLVVVETLVVDGAVVHVRLGRLELEVEELTLELEVEELEPEPKAK